MSDRASTDVSDEAILAVFARRDETLLRPPDVAEDLPVPVADLRDRFDDLDERGLIANEPDRRSGTAYRLTGAGASQADVPESDVVTDVEVQATGTRTTSSPRDHETTESQPPKPGSETAGRSEVPPADAIESFDPPGTPGQREQRRAALQAAYDYLRDRGIVHRSEFRVNVFPEAPGAYERPDDGWWEEVVRPGLATLPGPRYDADGDVWRFDHDVGRPRGD